MQGCDWCLRPFPTDPSGKEAKRMLKSSNRLPSNVPSHAEDCNSCTVVVDFPSECWVGIARCLVSKQFACLRQCTRSVFNENDKILLWQHFFELEVQKTAFTAENVLECDEGCMTAIFACIFEGCSVDALMKLDTKLADDEKKIAGSVQELSEGWQRVWIGDGSLAHAFATSKFQKTAITAEVAGITAWLNNFLRRSGSLRGQLQVLKGIEDSDIVKEVLKAASIAFGGGRPTNYPTVMEASEVMEAMKQFVQEKLEKQEKIVSSCVAELRLFHSNLQRLLAEEPPSVEDFRAEYRGLKALEAAGQATAQQQERLDHIRHIREHRRRIRSTPS